ncbi:MAG TPA: ATP-binding protein [Planctomycetota bacterium]|nr:ATP-binding protein [Planctomycetota bacterium]
MERRRFLRNLPIREKLRAIILFISGVSVVGACAVFVTYQWFTSRADQARRLDTLANIVGDQSTAALEFEQEPQAVTILASLKAERQIVAAAVYAKDGRIFARFVREGAENDRVAAKPGPDGQTFDAGDILTFRPLYSGKERIGTIFLRADRSAAWNRLWVNLATMGLVLLGAGAAILFLSARLGRLISEPIARLSAVVQSVSAKRDYSIRVEGGGRDELGRLIDGFNDMLLQVEQRNSALAKARDELEQRVLERTRELEQEVAERKAAEKQLQEKDLRLTEAHEISQLGSWEWHPATNKLTWSDEVYRMTGVLPTHFKSNLPETVAMVNHPDDRQAIQDAMETSRARREPFSTDTRIIRPDGSIRHLHVQGKPVLDDAGQVVRLVGTVQDITERKRADQAILTLNAELRARMDELAMVNKELESFSYSVSHDLRAPLRAIDGFSRMLIEDFAERVDGEGRRYLEVIMENTRKMGQLIDDLLEFSKMGRKALLTTPLDMEGLVNQVCTETRTAHPDRALEMKVGSLPPSQGDPAMVKVVFANLVSNAVKYSRGRNPAVIEIGARVDAHETVYYVRDNGVGFEMQYAHKLFGVFQRLHPSHEFEGTGVGLALVQRIVQRHGGRAWAEGQVGVGATISFALPRHSAEGEVRESKGSAAGP